MQVTLTIWAATQSLPRAELAIIPPMKEEIQGFHMTPNFKKSVDPGLKSAASRSINLSEPSGGNQATVFRPDGGTCIFLSTWGKMVEQPNQSQAHEQMGHPSTGRHSTLSPIFG